MMTKLSKKLVGVVTGALISVTAAGSVQAGILLGAGTLNVANDLTRIQTTGGDVLEFLDLTETLNQLPSQALATYGAQGFAWATSAEINELLMAFNLPQAPADATPWAGTVDPAVQSDMDSFMSFLGITAPGDCGGGDCTVGFVDDLTINNLTAVINVGSVTNMSPRGVFSNIANFNSGDDGDPRDDIGTFLFRRTIQVAEPGTLALFGLGLAGLGLARRRRMV